MLFRATGVHAQAEGFALQRSDTAPKEWGTFRGATDKFLVFEDSGGTIRLMLVNSGIPAYREIKRN